MAVRRDVLQLDENSMYCKGRTPAQSYLKNKPMKVSIRFHGIVRRKSIYLFSFWNNRSENGMETSPSSGYTKWFRNLIPMFRTQGNPIVIDPATSYELWKLKTMNAAIVNPRRERRLLSIESYYIRNHLWRQIGKMSDMERKSRGAVNITKNDAANRANIKEAQGRFRNGSHGL